MSEEVKSVSIMEIALNDWNGDRKPDKELIDSIREMGMIQPIVVRPITEEVSGEGAKYQVVCGTRRLLAARKLGLEDVTAVIRVLGDEEAKRLTLIENIQRSEMTAIEESNAVVALLKLNNSIGEVAKLIGKSRAYVAECKAIANLDKDVLKYVTKKVDRPNRACLALLAQIRKGEQMTAIEDELYHSSRVFTTVEEMRAIVFASTAPLGESCPFDQTDDLLMPAAGSCTACKKRTGADSDLFGGVYAKTDRCMDEECFKEKVKASNRKKFEGARDALSKVKTVHVVNLMGYRPGQQADFLPEKQRVVDVSYNTPMELCKKKDAGSQAAIVAYPIERVGEVVYIKERERSETEGAAPVKVGNRCVGKEMITRRRLAWVIEKVKTLVHDGKPSMKFQPPAEMLKLVWEFGASRHSEAMGDEMLPSIADSVFDGMQSSILSTLGFRTVSDIDPQEMTKNILRVLDIVSDVPGDLFDQLETEAANEIGAGRKKKDAAEKKMGGKPFSKLEGEEDTEDEGEHYGEETEEQEDEESEEKGE